MIFSVLKLIPNKKIMLILSSLLFTFGISKHIKCVEQRKLAGCLKKNLILFYEYGMCKLETDRYQIQEKELVDEVTIRTSEVEHLERELELMKAAAETAFDNQQSIDVYLDQLTEQVHAKRDHFSTLESEW